jgi:hypothetical protein
MVRGDIIGGLKIALQRGESLQTAMQSFYNAGYSKEDIEEAARVLKQEGFTPEVHTQQPTLPKTQSSPSQPKPKKPLHPAHQPPLGGKYSNQSIINPPLKPKQVPKPKPKSKPAQAPLPPQQQRPVVINQNYPTRQVVSRYESKGDKGMDIITILLAIILLVLELALA